MNIRKCFQKRLHVSVWVSKPRLQPQNHIWLLPQVRLYIDLPFGSRTMRPQTDHISTGTEHSNLSWDVGRFNI